VKNKAIMKHDNEIVQPHDGSVQLDETTVCEDCGRVGAYRVGDHALCLDCYSNRGSCCPEFGRDDLWTFSDEDGGPRSGAT
jgi:hypothetical protein